jgi:hypothetical protein
MTASCMQFTLLDQTFTSRYRCNPILACRQAGYRLDRRLRNDNRLVTRPHTGELSCIVRLERRWSSYRLRWAAQNQVNRGKESNDSRWCNRGPASRRFGVRSRRAGEHSTSYANHWKADDARHHRRHHGGARRWRPAPRDARGSSHARRELFLGGPSASWAAARSASPRLIAPRIVDREDARGGVSGHGR